MHRNNRAFVMIPWLALASAAMVVIPGCDDDDGAEEVGEEIDEAADELEDALD